MIKFSFVLIALLAWSKGWAQESSLVLNPKLDSADRALRSGDISSLNSMLAETSISQARTELLRAYISRIRGDIDNSDDHAIHCAQVATKTLQSEYDVNYKCKSLLAGNALIRGDYVKWSSLIHSSTSDVEEHVRKTVLTEAPGQYTKDVKILAPAAISIPPIEGKSPQFLISGFETKVQRVFLNGDAEKIDAPSEPFRVIAQVNGISTVIAFDTGGSATVIGGKSAHSLGLSPQKKSGRISYYLTFESRQVDVFFAHIKSLKVGAFSASDVTVLVSDDLSVENVIGLDLIQGMGPIKLSSSRLDFLASTDCKGELRLATDLLAGTKVIMGLVSIDGKSVPADIDTGNGEQLAVYNTDQSNGLVEASVQGLPSRAHRILKKTNDVGSDYNLGNDILNQYDMTIDIKKGHFCLGML